MDVIKTDILVIGAGAVGLSIAAKLVKLRQNVVVIDMEKYVGSHTSSRNSEVIHAGLYYKSGSLKESFCLSGKKLLYDYIKTKGIKYRQCGKVIFSNHKSCDSELDIIYDRASAAGVSINYLSQQKKKYLPDFIKVSNALETPETGIFDSHAFLYSLLDEIESSGGVVARNTRFDSLYSIGEKIVIKCRSSNEVFLIETRKLINAAGLYALDIAKNIEMVSFYDYANYFVKGHYYSYVKDLPVEKLYYPLPSDLGLGIHLTIDLSNNIRFGPDSHVSPFREDYSNAVDERQFKGYVLQNFKVDEDKLNFSYCGIRPKINKSGKIMDDFIIHNSNKYNIIHMIGIDSPGLTSSLAIAEYVAEII